MGDDLYSMAGENAHVSGSWCRFVNHAEEGVDIGMLDAVDEFGIEANLCNQGFDLQLYVALRLW